jgi:hypothetical protein
MTTASEVSLYLGFATAIGTFSAAAVALGLFDCDTRGRRAIALLVLLCAALGIIGAFATVSAGRTSTSRDLLLILGLLVSASALLWGAIRKIYTPASESEATREGLRKEMRAVYAGFVAVVVAVSSVAAPELWQAFFRNQPVTALFRSSDKSVRMLLAIDRSASMGCPIDIRERCPSASGKLPDPRDRRPRRFELAVGGARDALTFLRTGDSVGVWTFSSSVTSLRGIQPVTEQGIRSLRAGLNNRQGAPTAGSTHLYDVIFEGVRELRRGWRKDSVNALVIFTDGLDRGSARRSEAELDRALLVGDPHIDKPVTTIITAASGVDCGSLLTNVTVLRRRCLEVDSAADVHRAYQYTTELLRQLANR